MWDNKNGWGAIIYLTANWGLTWLRARLESTSIWQLFPLEPAEPYLPPLRRSCWGRQDGRNGDCTFLPWYMPECRGKVGPVFVSLLHVWGWRGCVRDVFPLAVTLRPTISLPQPAVCCKSCLIVRSVGSASLFVSRVWNWWTIRLKLKEPADQALDMAAKTGRMWKKMRKK